MENEEAPSIPQLLRINCNLAKELRRLQAENKRLKEQVEKLTGELLLIDNYCRINDIDLEQALKETQ